MASSLTAQDVARLLSEPSPDLRAELAEKVAANLSSTVLAPAEVALAQDIVRILARDVEAKVRASLSRGLRNCRSLPHDLARRMADDIDVVALPMLSSSMVLTDEDLVEIVRGGSVGKQEAIAGRADLTEVVSDSIIMHAWAPAVVVLMTNDTAHISESSLDRAVTRFADNEWVKQSMVMRLSLPITVSERLVTMVSKEFQELLVNRHALSPRAAADIVMLAREQEIIHLSTGAAADELQRMVGQMHHNGRLTPTLMLRALCTGDIAFFEAAMAVKGDVPVANAQILIHEPSRRGLEGLYRKAVMPDALYAAIRAAVEVVDETAFDGNPRDLERFRARVISRVLTLVEQIDPSDADYLIDKLGDVLLRPSDALLPDEMFADGILADATLGGGSGQVVLLGAA